MTTQLTEKKLKAIVKESVHEALDSRLLKLGALLVPHVSKKEQHEIEKLYKAPSKKASKSHFIKV